MKPNSVHEHLHIDRSLPCVVSRKAHHSLNQAKLSSPRNLSHSEFMPQTSLAACETHYGATTGLDRLLKLCCQWRAVDCLRGQKITEQSTKSEKVHWTMVAHMSCWH